MNSDQMDRAADAIGTPMFRMERFDHCCIGIVTSFGMDPVFCYSMDLIVADLKKQGMKEDEAWEYLEFNMLGAGLGKGTPCFFTDGRVYG